MIRIRDPIHGTVRISELEEKILDSSAMQRLRGIRQLAVAYLVYPGANHTRFEHSIGTLYLANKICEELWLKKEKTEKIRLAALLHDIGHIAFSHESEEVLKQKLGDHEKIGERLITKGEIAELVSQNFDPKEIATLYKKPIGQIISSDIGADRMDYLLRDSHYTGVAYGVIDADRICSTLKMGRDGIILTEGGLSAAESLLVARFTMFNTVYFHKTVRIASRMLQEAIKIALKEDVLEPSSVLDMNDYSMLEALKASSAKEIVESIQKRRLYKKVCNIPISFVSQTNQIEQELSEKCGCRVLADVPKISVKTKIKFEKEDGKVVLLSEESELVASLQKMQNNRLDIMLMCEEKFVNKVKKSAENLVKKIKQT